jgi:hypothetical protein
MSSVPAAAAAGAAASPVRGTGGRKRRAASKGRAAPAPKRPTVIKAAAVAPRVALTDAQVESIILRLLSTFAWKTLAQYIASRGKRPAGAVAGVHPDWIGRCVTDLATRLLHRLGHEVRAELAGRGGMSDVYDDEECDEDSDKNNPHVERVVDWIVDGMCPDWVGFKNALQAPGSSLWLFDMASIYKPLALSLVKHHQQLGLRLDEDEKVAGLSTRPSVFTVSLIRDATLVSAIADRIPDLSLNCFDSGGHTPLIAVLLHIGNYGTRGCDVLQVLFDHSNIDGSGVDVLTHADRIETDLSEAVEFNERRIQSAWAKERMNTFDYDEVKDLQAKHAKLTALLTNHTTRVQRFRHYRSGFEPAVRDALAAVEGPFPPPLATMVCEYGIYPRGPALAKMYGWDVAVQGYRNEAINTQEEAAAAPAAAAAAAVVEAGQ